MAGTTNTQPALHMRLLEGFDPLPRKVCRHTRTALRRWKAPLAYADWLAPAFRDDA
jgi:hypothetical protein